MDKEHVDGMADKAKGMLKEATGKATDDADLESEGVGDKAKGEAHKRLGDAKDAAKEKMPDENE